VRKGSRVPYLSHLLAVCASILSDGGSEDEAIAGLLHDSLEDHPELVTREELERRFGARVRSIVELCTDTPEDYTGGVKPPWRERKQRYLRHLEDAPADALRVSIADKVDNVRAMAADYRSSGESLRTRFNAGKTEQLWYYRTELEQLAEAGQ
jgi:(p)ppGpp synthase/HD superfamily hydrolase